MERKIYEKKNQYGYYILLGIMLEDMSLQSLTFIVWHKYFPSIA